jgi:2-oxoglutarate ferredoxin oxidoreductase subunit beta
MTSLPLDIPTLTRKDFASNQEVRWCPGCGDYSILAQMQKVMPKLGIPKENIVFISGIGCSSRFPYYMNTYGIHSIHGRAPTLATGLALTNPDLSVWGVTGDGDGLSIGGNHLMHAFRRNVNLKIILFNNRVYGLTKGQYSPTSRTGYKSKSSPMGSLEQPLNPIALALAAGASFVARTMDNQVKHLEYILSRAATHTGTAFVEIYQNCIIFNPNEWTDISDRKIRDDNLLFLEDGKPMVFGKNMDKGIRVGPFLVPEIVEVGDDPLEAGVFVHDEYAQSPFLGQFFTQMENPVPMGIFRHVQRQTYGQGLRAQVAEAQAKQGGLGDLNQLYRASDTWEVTAAEPDS